MFRRESLMIRLKPTLQSGIWPENPCAHPNSNLLIDWIGYFTPVGGGVHKRQAVYSLKLFYDSSNISGFYTYSKLAFRSIAMY